MVMQSVVFSVAESDAAEPVTVHFNYNYTGAPAAPASFTKTTGNDGKLASFPVEQTLPQVGARAGGNGSTADYGFAGWYRNLDGTGEKVTLDTVFIEDTELYAKWENVPSLYKEYQDYFLFGQFGAYSAAGQVGTQYNINCPANEFKLSGQLDTNNSRSDFTAARTRISADDSLTEEQKEAALIEAAGKVRINAQVNTGVMATLNNMRTWNNTHPDDKRYARFHCVAWHGGQQPNQFFTMGYSYSNDANGLSRPQDITLATNDDAFATREIMKARLDDYIRQLVDKLAPYSDIIVSWDIINEPVDDFTGQIRNGSDSNSQRGQWGLVWHDKNPAKNPDGSNKFGTAPDEMGVIYNQDRLYDESEWMRQAFTSIAYYSDKWNREHPTSPQLAWGFYVNDYMDSNKLYTKLEPTFDILRWIRRDVDLKGFKLGYGFQGRLAWAYPTIDMLKKQAEDALEICDEIAVTEGDIRSDFEPNPFFDPTQQTRPVRAGDTPKWTAGDLNSGSGSTSNPTASTLTNTFDTHNSPVRRIPEWGTGSGMTATTDSSRYDCTGWLPISEAVMKKQADFAADWMDILLSHPGKVELFQWDGTRDNSTFNSNKGAHLWVSGITGRTGTFEKYSFYAVAGAPNRYKLSQALLAAPQESEAGLYIKPGWNAYVAARKAAEPLVTKRIYTLEGVNDVKAALADLNAAVAALRRRDGTISLAAGGNTAQLINGTDGTVSATLILAGYDTAGRLAYLERVACSADAADHGYVTFAIDRANFADATFTVFGWDDLVPLALPASSLL
jgi:hypothetical protein